MKKCSSCTKDLPDAALHCVFCGAKQPLAPAQPAGMQKTMMGYDAAALIGQMKQPSGGMPSQPQPMPQPKPMPMPQPMPMPPPQAAMPTRAQPPSQPPPGPGGVPMVGSNAATMFVQSGGGMPQPQPSGPAPMNAYPGPNAGGFQPPTPQQAKTVMAQPMMQPPPPTLQPAPPTMVPPSAGMGMQAPSTLTPPAPLPNVPRPRAVTGVNPIEPYKDSLRLWMLVWGVLVLASFATPLSTDPLIFGWDGIIHGEGKQLLLALVVPAIGLLSVIVAVVPMPSPARGAVAVVLAAVGILLPPAVTDFPPWQFVVSFVGILVLVPGLLLRNEYRDAMLPRLLITIGVVVVLATLLIPVHDEIPLVALVKGLIDGNTAIRVSSIVGIPFAAAGAKGGAAFGFPLWIVPGLALIVIIVMSLLAWMPPPATAGGNVFAWLVIVWPAIALVLFIAVVGDIGATITKAPGMLLAWAPTSAVVALFGYGFATLLGKQLE